MKTTRISVGRCFSLSLCALIGVFLVPLGRSGPGSEPPAALDAAITQRPVFLYPLVWVGPQQPSPGESGGLWAAIEVLRMAALLCLPEFGEPVGPH